MSSAELPARSGGIAGGRPAERLDRRLFFRLPVILSFALAISLVMVARSQVGGDQLHMLARGWLLAAQGTWVPFGMNTSAGGTSPGGMIALLVGAPLLVWRDYRAPTLLIAVLHLIGYLLLDRVLARAVSHRGRVLFALLYWLNPWRVYFSGHLWNANFMFFVAAVHAWTSFHLRQRASFWLSFFHVLALGVAVQLHSSAAILVFASLLLLWRGYAKPHWGGVAAAGVLTIASLLPWVSFTVQHPEQLPGGTGFLGRGLLYLFPLLRGLVYWLRYPSLFFTKKMAGLDFTVAFGTLADTLLARPLWALLMLIGPLTLLFPLLANWHMWRADRRWLRERAAESWSPRRWLHGYVVACFAAAVLSFAISPTTIMAWQGLIILHAAVLPLVFWVEALLRTRVAGRAAAGVAAYAAISACLLLAMSFAAPMYRKGGRDAVSLTLSAPHQLLEDLGVRRHCTVIIDPAKGWWDVVLPPPPAATAPR